MRFYLCVAVLITLPSFARADIGWYAEGGLGKAYASGGFNSFDDGGFAVRDAVGLRGAHWGGELFVTKAELNDGTDFYDAFTFGPMVTARQVLTRTKMDFLERRLEVYGRIGPTFTIMTGDPGEGPADGASDFDFTAGGGLRWVYTAIVFSFDVTLVRAHLHKDAKHDLGDELHLMDEPAFDLGGNVVAVTLGFGFELDFTKR